jgi:hypothetical protein
MTYKMTLTIGYTITTKSDPAVSIATAQRQCGPLMNPLPLAKQKLLNNINPAA